MDGLQKVLPVLLPLAIAWAEFCSQEGARTGQVLSEGGARIARQVGVAHPELVRIKVVDAMPAPQDPRLRLAAQQVGLLLENMAGLTLGSTIFLRRGYEASVRLLSHECCHVAQYEQAGSIERYLTSYLPQLLAHGYQKAPDEADARAHEIQA